MKKEYEFRSDLFRQALFNMSTQAWTQADRAHILGVSQSTLSRLESGERKPNIDELLTVCNNSDFSPSDFFWVNKTTM